MPAIIPCIDEPEDVTARLCHWVHGLDVSEVPEEILTRAKYLILDGIGCGLVGARVPWSEKYIEATREFESPGTYSVIGQRDVSVHPDHSIPILTLTFSVLVRSPPRQ